MANATGSARDRFIAEFARMESRLIGAHVDWVATMRREALARFERIGLPGRKDESWRFTNIAPIEQTVFAGPDPEPIVDDGIRAAAGRFAIAGLDAHRIVFVNGVYQPALSNFKMGGGLRITAVANAIDRGDTVFGAHFGENIAGLDHPFTVLNAAFFQDGAFVHVADGAVVDKPIHLIYLAAAGARPLALHPRTLVVAGRAAQATILETYAGIGEGAYLSNGVTEMLLAEDAHVDHYKLQIEGPGACHVQSLYARQMRSSNLRTHSFALGAALARQNVSVVLGGEGSETVLNGLYAIGGTQHCDTHTRLDHALSHGRSAELYKGILDGRASGVFTGRIKVHPDAQKTDAYQKNKALLLSDDAVVNTQPQLEIFADDVKCTHGATVGQLDAESAFYLRARGIGSEEARALLTFAFAGEVIDQVRIEPLRGELGRLIAEKFHAHNPLAEPVP